MVKAIIAALALVPAAGLAQQPAAEPALADSLIRRALRTRALPYVATAGPARRWDEGRWFNVATRLASEDARGMQLFACLVRLAPRQEPPRCLPMALPGLDPRVDPASVTFNDFAVEDLDQDSLPEVWLELSYAGPPRRDGEQDQHTRVFIFDATRAPRFVFVMATRFESQSLAAHTLAGRLLLRDENGDGHQDLVLEGEACPPRNPDGCRLVERVFLWNRAADAWRESRAARP